MSKITYSTKSDINTTATPEVNKVTAANMNEIKTVVNNNTPVGLISMYSGTTAPTGWLICDGSAISRTTYATLFGVIGTTYGSGDGSTTFNLPNLKGKVPVGIDANDDDFNLIGKTGGSKYIQSHKHSVEWSVSDGNAENRVRLGSQSGGSGTGAYGYAVNENMNVQTGNSGNLQPYIVLNYIISY